MKIAIGVMSLLFAIYLAIESYLISSLGTSYQIPQLEGDGGGGLVAAGILLVSGIIVFWRPLWACLGFVLSTGLVVIVGLEYQDNLTLFFAMAPALFLGLSLFTVIQTRKTTQPAGKKTSVRAAKLDVQV
jgi:hypothetical protein